MSTAKRRKDEDDDDDPYVDPSESARRPRVDYAWARLQVESRQHMQRSPSNQHMMFESAITPGSWHRLDLQKREVVGRAPHKKHKADILQQPALDHIVQYAAIDEEYVDRVEKKRAKAPLDRAGSFELFEKFKAAAADPENLRVLVRAEHLGQGGTKQKGQFKPAERRGAATLFDKPRTYTPPTPSQLAAFISDRPAAAHPLPPGISAPAKRRTPGRGGK